MMIEDTTGRLPIDWNAFWTWRRGEYAADQDALNFWRKVRKNMGGLKGAIHDAL